MAAVFRSSYAFRALARVPATRAITISRHLRTTAAATAAKGSASETPFFPNEPASPQIKTPIPGPKNQKAIAELNQVFDTSSSNMLVNYDASVGN